MTVVLQKDYHAKKALEGLNIDCKTQDEAIRQDIRELRIGILNIMPQAENYEFNLLHPLGRSILQIEPVWIRCTTHQYKSTNKDHLCSLYASFKEAISSPLDGLIITGAPVEEIPFEEISYWPEIIRILKYAKNNIASTLGICWGAMALAKFLGIEHTIYPKKLFGVYKAKNLAPHHRITGGMDDEFWCPQSRHGGIDDSVLELEKENGKVNLLAHGRETGYTIFESSDQRFLMHLGHPEYHRARIIEEYQRDMKLGRTDVSAPTHFNIDDPVNTWRFHRTEFFIQWIKYLHETTLY